MNRKYLLGGALLTTLGVAGAPWIEDTLKGGDDAAPVSVSDFENDLEVGFDDGFALEGDFTDASELASESEGEVVDDELGGLLAAVEGLGANLRGGSSMNSLFSAEGEPTAVSGLPTIPVVDADRLRERYPLSSLVLGQGRTVAQLGGELATVGSVLSDGRTRVRRITERGVELLHQGEVVWVALPPVRYVPSSASDFQAQPAASSTANESQTGDPLLDL